MRWLNYFHSCPLWPANLHQRTVKEAFIKSFELAAGWNFLHLSFVQPPTHTHTPQCSVLCVNVCRLLWIDASFHGNVQKGILIKHLVKTGTAQECLSLVLKCSTRREEGSPLVMNDVLRLGALPSRLPFGCSVLPNWWACSTRDLPQ